MEMEHRKLKAFEESLVYVMERYQNGECELEDVLSIADGTRLNFCNSIFHLYKF